MLWVIVGDVPSAYLVCDSAPTWREALESYIFEMEKWVAAVRGGDSLGNVIPVGAEPTLEHAEMLATRLQFIRDEILAVEDNASRSDT